MMWHHEKSTHKTLVLPPIIIIIVICSSVRVFCLLGLVVLLVLLHLLQVVLNLGDSPCKVSVKDLSEGY